MQETLLDTTAWFSRLQRRGGVRSLLIPFLAAVLCGALQTGANADTLSDRLHALQTAQTVNVTEWRFHRPDNDGGQAVDLDDHDWQTVQPGFSWPGANTRVWFRTRITVPDRIAGFSTEGAPIRLAVGIDDDGEIYVDGKLAQQFHWDDGKITLTEHAHPGQTFVVALRGINTLGDGQLHFARLTYGLLDRWQPDLDLLIQEVGFVQQLAAHVPLAQKSKIEAALRDCEATFDVGMLQDRPVHASAERLAKARQALLVLTPITRQYRVDYVGHAHIDMNWLWTWPETIDVCHRTWDSALHLMDQFPDFGFVQSQPGAYVPIQQQFPDEFTRMQQAAARKQWDPVGGLWDESDDDMPSGEALARSLFLGQRYFHQQFGRYVETGWLPDSFGHSWQLPQLLQGAGISNFYHTRCSDGVRFAWWQSPDGSRVLKASTDSYDTDIDASQMLEPWDNAQRYGLKQSLVVFGVGDHGGGPTREQILIGKHLQADPLLPRVRFTTADAFFDRLHVQSKTASLPVIDADLQYTFEGCYTTHADLKKEVRDNENALYSAEVFSSLAAMHGLPYPISGFSEAWKPTAFAQFHDIMCGSGIHSTYTWMEDLLAPARRYARQQADRALQHLTASVDTNGAQSDEQTVVVWNPLSFTRDDVVHAAVDDASRFHSARDGSGQILPVQAKDDKTLVFVARGVPAFGHQVYFLSTAPAPASELTVKQGSDGFTLENSALRLRLDPATGLMTELLHKATGREVLRPDAPGDAFQLLGDGGNAWDIHYTGEKQVLADQGAQVSLIASGPVFATVRVVHKAGASTFTQDVTLYAGLPRVDVPTEVGWHEHGQMLKVAFPLNMSHPSPRVGIPYGSIARPDNGQENPGQKWMDVTEQEVTKVTEATPLDLKPLFNADSANSFDSDGRGYAPELFPAPGRSLYGASGVPIDLPGGSGRRNDCATCQGQTLSLPAGIAGNRLFLVGAGFFGAQSGMLTLLQADGRRVTRTFFLNDWVVGSRSDNEVVLDFAYRIINSGQTKEGGAAPHLWMTSVSLPSDSPVVKIVLPVNPQMRLFAATLAVAPAPKSLFGLTVLNDCKYGSDTNGSVFRLSLLRSSHDPDPSPDEGDRTFTYALLPHAGDWSDARAEQAGLALNLPLQAVATDAHAGRKADAADFTLTSENGRDDLAAGALKHSEDGAGYILRFFETQGRDTVAKLTFSVPVKVEETDLLERPLPKQHVKVAGRTVRLPVGHDKIVTLHITGLPDAGAAPFDAKTAAAGSLSRPKVANR